MVVIRCTAKLRKLFGVTQPDEAAVGDTRLGDWHANLIYKDPRDGFLVVNDKTRLPVVVRASSFSDFLDGFRLTLAEVLLVLGVPPHEVEAELGRMESGFLSKSNNRSVLATMNDFCNGVDARQDLMDNPVAMSLHLAETPCGPLDMNSPNRVVLGVFAN